MKIWTHCGCRARLARSVFDDSNVKEKEAKRMIERIMKLINHNSRRLLVVTSVEHGGKYDKLVMPYFDKSMVLSDAKNQRLNVDINNEGKKATVVLTKRELKMVYRR